MGIRAPQIDMTTLSFPRTGGTPLERMTGTPLDLARVRAVRVNQPAVARRIAALNGSRSVKKDYQAAWLDQGHPCAWT